MDDVGQGHILQNHQNVKEVSDHTDMQCCRNTYCTTDMCCIYDAAFYQSSAYICFFKLLFFWLAAVVKYSLAFRMNMWVHETNMWVKKMQRKI